MKKVKIIEITDHIFSLVDEDNNIHKKGLQFINTQYIPKIGDYITIQENILDENNIYTFGYIYNKNSDDIIKVESNNTTLYLQRYYG